MRLVSARTVLNRQQSDTCAPPADVFCLEKNKVFIDDHATVVLAAYICVPHSISPFRVCHLRSFNFQRTEKWSYSTITNVRQNRLRLAPSDCVTRTRRANGLARAISILAHSSAVRPTNDNNQFVCIILYRRVSRAQRSLNKVIHSRTSRTLNGWMESWKQDFVLFSVNEVSSQILPPSWMLNAIYMAGKCWIVCFTIAARIRAAVIISNVNKENKADSRPARWIFWAVNSGYECRITSWNQKISFV